MGENPSPAQKNANYNEQTKLVVNKQYYNANANNKMVFVMWQNYMLIEVFGFETGLVTELS